MHYKEWMRLGERLNLNPEELVSFIQKKEEEFVEREERARRREDEKRAIEMQHEYAMKEQELKIEKLRAQRRDETHTLGRELRPKLPKFDESQDDMDSYIERFERFARGQGWNCDTWATSLSSLLTGKDWRYTQACHRKKQTTTHH